MRTSRCFPSVLVPSVLSLVFAETVSAQQSARTMQPIDQPLYSPTIRQDEGAGGEPAQGQAAEGEDISVTDASPDQSEYREVSAFFNVREANSNLHRGEWELELSSAWQTGAGAGDDDFALWPSVKYGITDDMFAELEVLPLNLGDGGDQGNGDLAFVLFNQFVHEDDVVPALAAWAEMRIPSGDGSSGVDAEFHGNVTKTLVSELRGHLEGYVETANGGRGDEDEDRRHFQWGVGAGFDYQCDPDTIGIINYLQRSSEEFGNSNQHILELGLVRRVAENQHLKAAFDIGLDGQEETPDFGAKLQWTIEF